jgi:hypothetical protein
MEAQIGSIPSHLYFQISYSLSAELGPSEECDCDSSGTLTIKRSFLGYAGNSDCLLLSLGKGRNADYLLLLLGYGGKPEAFSAVIKERGEMQIIFYCY